MFNVFYLLGLAVAFVGARGLFLSKANSLLLQTISYFCALLVYNIFFHPLRNYPGPLPSRATRLVWDYYAFKGDLLRHVTQLHEIHGEVVRIAPNELSFRTAQAVSFKGISFFKSAAANIICL